MPPPEPATASGPSGGWTGHSSAGNNVGLVRPGEMTELRKLGTVRHAEVGSLVAAAGSPATHVHVVAEGELELMARVDGGRTTMAVVRAGGVIQDIPMLLAKPMPFDAVASSDTELIALSRDRWTELLHSSPTLAIRWRTSIARRLDEHRRRHVIVTSRPLTEQLAYLLLDLAEVDGTGRRVVRLSHTTMAQLLGARRQSVTRVIASLRRRARLHPVRRHGDRRPSRVARGDGRKTVLGGAATEDPVVAAALVVQRWLAGVVLSLGASGFVLALAGAAAATWVTAIVRRHQREAPTDDTSSTPAA